MKMNESLIMYNKSFISRTASIEKSETEFRGEILRKSIHLLIALTPTLAAFDRTLVIAALGAGTLVYASAEAARLQGRTVPVISRITALASRARDRDRFVLGPVTLGLGAMLALLFYPASAAAIAIYALAFGDGLASLVGRFFGKTRPAFLRGKSVEGSAACFVAVFASAYGVTRDARVAFFAAVVATLTEALPLEDYDNIALPLVVGFVVELFIRF